MEHNLSLYVSKATQIYSASLLTSLRWKALEKARQKSPGMSLQIFWLVDIIVCEWSIKFVHQTIQIFCFLVLNFNAVSISKYLIYVYKLLSLVWPIRSKFCFHFVLGLHPIRAKYTRSKGTILHVSFSHFSVQHSTNASYVVQCPVPSYFLNVNLWFQSGIDHRLWFRSFSCMIVECQFVPSLSWYRDRTKVGRDPLPLKSINLH